MSLIDRITSRLTQKVMCEINAADVRDGLFGMNASERQALVDAVRRQQTERVGRMICRAVVANVAEPRARQEATADAADGQLSVNTVTRIIDNEC